MLPEKEVMVSAIRSCQPRARVAFRRSWIMVRMFRSMTLDSAGLSWSWSCGRSTLVENSQHIGYEENHQYGTESYAGAAAGAPAAVAVVAATASEEQQQQDNQK